MAPSRRSRALSQRNRKLRNRYMPMTPMRFMLKSLPFMFTETIHGKINSNITVEFTLPALFPINRNFRPLRCVIWMSTTAPTSAQAYAYNRNAERVHNTGTVIVTQVKSRLVTSLPPMEDVFPYSRTQVTPKPTLFALECQCPSGTTPAAFDLTYVAVLYINYGIDLEPSACPSGVTVIRNHKAYHYPQFEQGSPDAIAVQGFEVMN